MKTQAILSAFALALAFGVAAPAFADDFPGVAVEKLTERLADQNIKSDIQPILSDAPELG